jgi:hypothetical protein
MDWRKGKGVLAYEFEVIRSFQSGCCHDGRQRPDGVEIGTLAQQMEHSNGIFAAAP